MRIMVVGLRQDESIDFMSCCSRYDVEAFSAPRDHASAIIHEEHVDAILWNPRDLPEAQHGLPAVESIPVPVLCIVHSASVPVEQLRALRSDDFLFHPFNPEEAICRLRLLVEKFSHCPAPVAVRTGTGQENIGPVEARARADDLTIAALRGRLVIDEKVKRASLDGEQLRLTKKEFLLLSLFARREGRVTSCEEIIRHVWPYKKRAGPADVQQYVYKLRRKLETNPQHPELILNAKGFGYMLAANSRT